MEGEELKNPPEQIIDTQEKPEAKDEVRTKYEPSPCQVEYLKAAISIGTNKNKAEVARVAEVRRQNWWEWLKVPGFYEWFMVEFKRAMASMVYELDLIGLQMAEKDFKYWEAMQQKYGGLGAKGVKGITINNSSSAKAVTNAEVEVGTEEAQKRLDRNLRILQRHGFNFGGESGEES